MVERISEARRELGGHSDTEAGLSGERPNEQDAEAELLLLAVAQTPRQPVLLDVGTALGPYRVQRLLGSGGMSVVYSAIDTRLDRTVAIKLLQHRPNREVEPKASLRIEKEGRALAKLSHPNVVTVFDVGVYKEETWIAMEYVNGCTLREWVAERPRSWQESLPLLIDVAYGLAAAHASSLVHRDLKPDNVMIGHDGRVRIMDFGLVHEYRVEHDDFDATTPGTSFEPTLPYTALTETGCLLGSPAYMAPERWKNLPAGPRTDQFAWAILAWETIYGARPFTGATIEELREQILGGVASIPPELAIPEWLSSAIRRGLAIDPTDRWPDVRALADELKRRLDSHPPHHHLARRRRILTISVGLAAATLIYAWSLSPRPKDDDRDGDFPLLDPDGCYISVEPALEEFTPPLNISPCSCRPGSPSCRQLYQGRALAIHGFRANLEFKKVTGGPPSRAVDYWILNSPDDPVCYQLDEPPFISHGYWSPLHDTLEVENVPIWDSEEEYRAAPAGAKQSLFLVTGNGAGDSKKRTWFQPKLLVFTKECPI